MTSRLMAAVRLARDAVGRAAWTAFPHLFARAQPHMASLPQRLPSALQRVAVGRGGGSRLAQAARLLRPALRAQPRLQVRAFANGLWRGTAALRRPQPPTHGQRLHQAWSESAGLWVSLEHVRSAFAGRGTGQAEEGAYPKTLDGYDLGSHIDKGCHAAVYEARLRPELSSLEPHVWDWNYVGRLAEAEAAEPKGVHHRNNATVRQQQRDLAERQASYPLAVKLLFNYGLGTSEEAILRSAGRELVPGTSAELRGLLRRDSPISGPSPFLVKLHTAFVGEMPVLPGAEELYPAALPADPLFEERFGLDRTLFVVMKRYTMTLTGYVRQYLYTVRTGTALVGQLWEALAFLGQSRVAHRDLKSNNLLLSFEHADETPWLVVSDFGCCLSSGGPMRVPYAVAEAADVQGNLELSPPEIRNARPGIGQSLNYERADLWAGGSLAYEIYTRVNPFYHNLSSSTYAEADLPALPAAVPRPVARVAAALLRREPRERPSGAAAATAAALCLFRGSAVGDTLARLQRNGRQMWESVRACVELFAAETVLGGLELAKAEADGPEAYFASDQPLSRAELALRATFLARLDKGDISDALPFFRSD